MSDLEKLYNLKREALMEYADKYQESESPSDDPALQRLRGRVEALEEAWDIANDMLGHVRSAIGEVFWEQRNF